MASKGVSAPMHAAPGVAATSSSSSGFPASTHARCWLFGGDEDLHQTRVHAQKKARKRITKLNASNAAHAAASTAVSNSAAMSDVAAPASPSSKPSTAASADAMLISPAPVKEKKASSDGADLQPLSLIEEQQLRLHYVAQLTQMAQLLNLPSYVRHAAIIFFKRFYLRESVMEFSPKEVAYCCIFLATKSEEVHVPLEKIIAVIQNKTQVSATPADVAAAVAAAAANATMVSTVLALEVAVLTQLQFQLRLYSFQRALKGLMLELVEFQSASTARLIRIHTPRPADTASVPNPPTETIESFLTARATALYEHILLDDVLIFLYAPAQLALGALVLAGKDIRNFAIDAPGMPLSDKDAAVSAAALKQMHLVERYVATKPVGGKAHPSANSAAAVPSLPSPLQMLVDRLALLPPPSTDKKQLKSIEKRRKVLSNPLTDPTSAASQQEKIAREREKEVKRDAKKKKQREENTKAEEAFLMDEGGQGKAGGGSSMFDDADDDEGFSIHKRMKSAQGTPIQLAKIPMND